MKVYFSPIFRNFFVLIHRLRSAIGEMLASLGDLEVLVFTAGVGENVVVMRKKTREG